MIGLHIQHIKGIEMVRNYMYTHVSISKGGLRFDFQGSKKRVKRRFKHFRSNAGYRASEL
jgi:hypothetical protein